MKCPCCQKTAIRIFKFIISDYRYIKCSSCKTTLKANKTLMTMFWLTVAYIIFMLSSTAFIAFVLKQQELAIILMIALLVPGCIFELKAWKEGSYKSE